MPWKSAYFLKARTEASWRAGRCKVTTLSGHSAEVRSLAFEDNIAVSGSNDLSIRVWRLREGAG